MYPLGVEPDVPLFRVLGGQAVVLPVVAPHKDAQPRRGAEFPRLAGTLGLLSALCPEVAAVSQLGADVVEVLLGFGQCQLLKDTFQIGQLHPRLFQLRRDVLLRRFCLGVFFEILRRVLLRRQPHIQRDIHVGAVGVVVVLRRQTAHAPLHAVQVGGDQLAVHTPCVAVFALGQLLLLSGDLAAEPGSAVGGGFYQILPLLLHALGLLPLFIEVVQQAGEAGVRLLLRRAAVLPHMQVGEVHGHAEAFQHRRCKALFVHSIPPRGKSAPQRRSMPRDRGIRAAAGAESQFPRHQRRQAVDRTHQPLIRGRALPRCGGESREFLLCHCEGRYLVRRRGQVIKQPRQHLPVGVHLKVDAAQTVDDVSVLVRQYQVGAAGNGL